MLIGYVYPNPEVVAAYNRGEVIQHRCLFPLTDWEDVVCEPAWSSNFEYRVKPKPKAKPKSHMMSLVNALTIIQNHYDLRLSELVEALNNTTNDTTKHITINVVKKVYEHE